MDNIVTYKSPVPGLRQKVFLWLSPQRHSSSECSQVLCTLLYALSLLCKISPSQRDIVCFP